MQEATRRIIEAIKAIPAGTVCSYGQVAASAGLRNGARAVVRVLHHYSDSEKLPWWRVIKANGTIALQSGYGFEEQRALLMQENVVVSPEGKVITPSRSHPCPEDRFGLT